MLLGKLQLLLDFLNYRRYYKDSVSFASCVSKTVSQRIWLTVFLWHVQNLDAELLNITMEPITQIHSDKFNSLLRKHIHTSSERSYRPDGGISVVHNLSFQKLFRQMLEDPDADDETKELIKDMYEGAELTIPLTQQQIKELNQSAQKQGVSPGEFLLSLFRMWQEYEWEQDA